MRGRFISFEGGEGAGKSTQINRLAQWLEEQGHDTLITREPGGTPDAERLRDLVVQGDENRWSSMEEMLIMYTARSQHVRTLIQPALSKGTWVLADRFADSTTVYQGLAGGISPEKIAVLHKLVLDDFQPDITIVLDVPLETSAQRVRDRGENLTRFETRKLAFMHKVRDGFLTLSQQEPGRIKVIDGSQNERDVAIAIQDKIHAAFPQEIH